MKNVERRKMERFTLNLKALLSVLDKDGEQKTIEAITRDISSGGAFLNTENSFPIGTKVNLGIFIPLEKFKNIFHNHSRIDVAGSVLRSEPQGMAVRFDTRYEITAH